jgi:hypothetical protein
MTPRKLLTLIALSATVLPSFAFAQRVQVTLEDRTLGRTIPLNDFNGRLYAAGEPGHRYAIRLTNRTGERVMAVVSVDGVNVVTGQTANPLQSGYVLGPWQSTTINGWRKNMSEIAAFNFAPLPESYAARTGRPGDVGVIGVAVFDERRWVRPYEDDQILSKQAPAPSVRDQASAEGSASRAAPGSSYSEADKRLGTGHGEREWSYARTTEFVRASSQPAEVDAIWYDSRRNLVAAGILPRQPRQYADRGDARPFPGFVPDPW